MGWGGAIHQIPRFCELEESISFLKIDTLFQSMSPATNLASTEQIEPNGSATH